MAGSKTRWGILSAGRIAEDFTKALTTLLPEEHKVVAVAARNKEDAEHFGKRFGIGKAYGGYDNLGEDPDVEIVYVATIHPHHAEWSKKMLRAGKHVLCEKPVTMNSRQLEDVLAVAKETGKFFMEGYWSRCFPIYDRLRDELAKEAVGEVKMVSADFGLPSLWEFKRVNQRSLGGGAMLDVGCYCVQFADLVLGPGMPEKITATGILTDDVDTSVSITLVYPGKKMAVLTTSVNTYMTCKAIVRGTAGIIEMPQMYGPSELLLPSGKVDIPSPEVDADAPSYNFSNGQSMVYEAMEVRRCLVNGLVESPKVPHSSSRTIMAIIDEIRRQIGVVYDVDV